MGSVFCDLIANLGKYLCTGIDDVPISHLLEKSNFELIRHDLAQPVFTPTGRMHPNDGRVVSNFVVQALQGQDITVFWDGDPQFLLHG